LLQLAIPCKPDDRVATVPKFMGDAIAIVDDVIEDDWVITAWLIEV
jgi:hypothetical protein